MAGPRGRVLGWEAYRASIVWLPQAREAAALSRADLADRLGKPAEWVAIRERGKMRMTQAEVELIAGALEVEVPALSGEGSLR